MRRQPWVNAVLAVVSAAILSLLLPEEAAAVNIPCANPTWTVLPPTTLLDNATVSAIALTCDDGATGFVTLYGTNNDLINVLLANVSLDGASPSLASFGSIKLAQGNHALHARVPSTGGTTSQFRVPFNVTVYPATFVIGYLDRNAASHDTGVYGVLLVDDIVRTDRTLLPNTTVRLHIAETGCTPVTAVRAALDFAQINGANALLGPSCSAESRQVHVIASLFKLPMLSFWSATTDLSNKLVYPFFLRGLDPLSETYDLASTISAFGWKSIALLEFDIFPYADQLFTRLSEMKVEVKAHYVVRAGTLDYSPAMRLLKQVGSRVVLLNAYNVNAQTQDFNGVIRAAIAEGLVGSGYTWIFGTSAGFSIADLLPAERLLLAGCFSVVGADAVGDTALRARIANLWNTKDLRSLAGPWGARITMSASEGQPGVPNTLDNQGSAGVDSYLTLVKAYHKLAYVDKARITQDSFLAELFRTTFYGATGTVAYDANGDRLGNGALLNYRIRNGTLDMNYKIGTIFFDALHNGVYNLSVSGFNSINDTGRIVWSHGLTSVPPAFVCARGCVHGNCTAHDTCVCNNGWASQSGNPDCAKAICAACEHGICTAPNVCACDVGWSGSNCAVPSSSSGSDTGRVVGAAVGASGGIALLAIIVGVMLIRRRKSASLLGHENWVVNIQDVKFERIIGQGSFGDVYKARWRGSVVAVKTISGALIGLPSMDGRASNGEMVPLNLISGVTADPTLADDDRKRANQGSMRHSAEEKDPDIAAYRAALGDKARVTQRERYASVVATRNKRNGAVQPWGSGKAQRSGTILHSQQQRDSELSVSGPLASLLRSLFKSFNRRAADGHMNKADREAVKEFVREIACMCGLRHPNIVMFMGACVRPPGPIFLVTEYLERGTLVDLFDDTSVQFTWKLRRELALSAARGMAYLHSASPPILHLDLKSANVLVSDTLVCKISDFGLSMLKGQRSWEGERVGTALWMAPEIIGAALYTEKSDVYSFGIILWEIAFRSLPYMELDGIATVQQLLIEVSSHGCRPTPAVKGFPSYRTIVEACWDQEPERRPSFAEVCDSLEGMGAEAEELDLHAKR
eukprot:Opistho-2@42595